MVSSLLQKEDDWLFAIDLKAEFAFGLEPHEGAKKISQV